MEGIERPWWLDTIIRLAAPTVLFSIGLVSRSSELKAIVQPSRRLNSPLSAFLVMVVLLVVVSPLTIYNILLTVHLPPYFNLGFTVLVCTPGGLASNVFAIALNASVEMNAVLTLTGTLVSLLLLPAAFEIAVPSLLGMPAEEILSPWPTLLSNLVAIFVPLPIGFYLGNRCPFVRRPLRILLGPIAALFIVTVLITQLPILTVLVSSRRWPNHSSPPTTPCERLLSHAAPNLWACHVSFCLTRPPTEM